MFYNALKHNGFFILFLRAEISDDEAEDRLQDAIQERFAVFGDVRASGINKD